jgi:hypothetical protein
LAAYGRDDLFEAGKLDKQDDHAFDCEEKIKN